MHKPLLTLIFLLSYFTALTQINTLAKDAEISIITIGPGKQLYDSFGHNAIRVSDPSNGKDLAFNYGTFDFNTPNFYIKFGQGKLPYALSVSTYDGFLRNYIAEKRWIKQQKLDLTYGEKIAIFEFLLNNAQPSNREYQYDFFLDNCATRIRDVLAVNLGSKLSYQDKQYAPFLYSFRELIQQRLHWNSWGSLGIDIALGAVIDRTANPWEHQFLPDYVFESLKSATITRNNKTSALIKKETTINNPGPRARNTAFLLSPFFVFLVIALGIVYRTLRDSKQQKRSRWLDTVLFFVTGIVGVLLLVLWLATDHTATINNYNILWAFPVNLIFCTLLSKKTPKKWLSRYLSFLIILLTLLVVHWCTSVQVFAGALLPLLIALSIRYVYVIRYLKK
ncbi:MAG: Uncharacterised protein [Flavobacteriaceae bacterium]|nr:MAG: Uncharacterised protein [Flavobacteriaceae bacterium]